MSCTLQSSGVWCPIRAGATMCRNTGIESDSSIAGSRASILFPGCSLSPVIRLRDRSGPGHDSAVGPDLRETMFPDRAGSRRSQAIRLERAPGSRAGAGPTAAVADRRRHLSGTRIILERPDPEIRSPNAPLLGGADPEPDVRRGEPSAQYHHLLQVGLAGPSGVDGAARGVGPLDLRRTAEDRYPNPGTGAEESLFGGTGEGQRGPFLPGPDSGAKLRRFPCPGGVGGRLPGRLD